ncbi:MAG: nuclear transport factor 2 family protein [Deltaproteobacteria bacterium]|nr:nuclear transport factor 2 family protein [Candidatus Zymogenaceae bacterium]
MGGKDTFAYSDIVEIEQVLYRCSHAVDKGEIETTVSLFQPDAALVITWEENGRHEGHDVIRKWFENYEQGVRSSTNYLRHRITCPVIDVDGDCASASSYLEVEAASKSAGTVIKTVGRYEDTLVRTDKGWRFAEKVIYMDNTYAV